MKYDLRGLELNSEESKKEEVVKKTDVSRLVSIIPPASELFKKEKVLSEKRIRVRYDESLPEDRLKIHKDLASMLGLKQDDDVELVVAGKKRFVYKVVIVDNIESEVVFCNPNLLVKNGVADNSIATIRKHAG